MDIYSQQGQLVNLAVADAVHVSIADLMNADVLSVKINKRADAQKLLPFFQATPIADPLADVFAVIQGIIALNSLPIASIGWSATFLLVALKLV